MTRSHAEVEDKYAVSAAAEMPALEALAGVAFVVGPVRQVLGATYFDTADLRLTGAGITVRRRTGGEDEGWHLKLPRNADRYEVQVPLGEAEHTVPERLQEVVVGVVRGSVLSPVAMVRTSRAMYRLQDVEGRVLAEVADDVVSTQALSLDPDEDAVSSRSWREWEVELVEGDRSLLEAAAELFESVGATPSTSGSKLAQALGGRVPVRGSRSLPSESSAPPTEVVSAWLLEQVQELRRHDPLVRADAPDGVHKMRVATRRLRSAFATFRPLLEREVTDPVREELKWIAGVLGEARDAEVMHRRLSGMLSEEQPLLVRGGAGARVDRALADRYDHAHAHCVRAMTSERYFALLDRLGEIVAEPPWRNNAYQRAPDVLTDRVRHDWKRLRRRVRDVHETDDEDARALLLHEVRKAAKRVRYAAEPLVPQYGRPAKRFVGAAERIQSVLGDHQDSIVTQTELRRLADAAVQDGADAFTFGVLHAREDLNQLLTEDRLWDAWARASKKKRRTWLT